MDRCLPVDAALDGGRLGRLAIPKAWAFLRCATAGLPTTDVVEDLTHDEWYHTPDTDQIDRVDPIDNITSSPNRRTKISNKGGVRKRGRKPRSPAYKMRFAPSLTPGTNWEEGVGRVSRYTGIRAILRNRG